MLSGIISFVVGCILAYFIKPSSRATGWSVWARNSASWCAFILTVSLFHKVWYGINGAAIWVINMIIVVPLFYFFGFIAHWLFHRAKQAKASAPGFIEALTEKTVGITGQLRESVNPVNPEDSDIYAVVSKEMQRDVIDDGLWAKALSLANGDEKVAKARYIKLRVLQIKSQATGSSPSHKDDQELYAAISHEMEVDHLDKPLWTQALAESDGDDNRTRARYIKLRFARLVASRTAKAEETQATSQAPAAMTIPKQSYTQAKATPTVSTAERIVRGELDREIIALQDSEIGPLFLSACATGELDEIVEAVTRHPALLAVRDGDGNTGLHIAIMRRREDVAHYLVSVGAPVLLKHQKSSLPLGLAIATLQQSPVIAEIEAAMRLQLAWSR